MSNQVGPNSSTEGDMALIKMEIEEMKQDVEEIKGDVHRLVRKINRLLIQVLGMWSIFTTHLIGQTHPK